MPNGPLPFNLECYVTANIITLTETTQQSLSSKLDFTARILDACITQILQYQVPYNSHKTKWGSRSPETKIKVHVVHCLDQEIGHLTTLSETQVEEKKNKEQEMKLAKKSNKLE